MCASRWQAEPVVIWMAGTPLARIRAASFSVSRSPTMTAIRNSSLSASIVASSSSVFPDPGEDIRLSASTPWRSKCSRLCAASRSLALSRLFRTVTASWPCGFFRRARCSLPGVILQLQVSHMVCSANGKRRGVRSEVIHDVVTSHTLLLTPYEFDAGQQHFVAADQPGMPISTGAADQLVRFGGGFRAAALAAHAYGQFFNHQLRGFRHAARGRQRKNLLKQIRLHAG